ncbi:MAG: CCA tRNA nucleotidyltransferase [Clostridiaceae bacterium]
MINKLKENEKYIINLLKKISGETNANIYIVGGAVRDYLLDKESNDIDICVEYDVDKILETLAGLDKNITFKYHQKFQTATIFYKEISIDLIRCRDEIYEFYGALPKITPSNIYDDLKRRDFTINAIAYDIINDSFIDYFNGKEDLKNKKLRKVHEDSYNEDFTRILRAIKYANRLNFNTCDEIEIRSVIEIGMINSISNDRFIKEVDLILEENLWKENLNHLNNYNLLNLNKEVLSKEFYYIKDNNYEDRVLKLYLSINDELDKEKLIDNSVLDKNIKKHLKKYNVEADSLINNIEKGKTNFELYQLFKKLDDIEIKLLSSNDKLFFKIYNYFENIKGLYDSSFIRENNLQLENKKDIEKQLKTYNKIRLNTMHSLKYEDFLKIEERF